MTVCVTTLAAGFTELEELEIKEVTVEILNIAHAIPYTKLLPISQSSFPVFGSTVRRQEFVTAPVEISNPMNKRIDDR